MALMRVKVACNMSDQRCFWAIPCLRTFAVAVRRLHRTMLHSNVLDRRESLRRSQYDSEGEVRRPPEEQDLNFKLESY